jgi:hypothetical protein
MLGKKFHNPTIVGMQVPIVRVVQRRRVTIVCSAYSFAPAVLGSMAAFTSTYPLDTIKTLTQNDIKLEKKHNLLSGYFPGLFVCCITTSVYFAMYSILSQHLSNIASAMVATMFSCAVKTPGKAIVKLMQNGDFVDCGNAMKFLHNQFGVYGFFRGYIPYLIDDVPENAIKFFLYDFFGTLFPEFPIIVGILTGFISSIVTQPLDVIQTKLLCNKTTDSLDYKKINYMSGLVITLVIHSIQAMVFYLIHHVIVGHQLSLK